NGSYLVYKEEGAYYYRFELNDYNPQYALVIDPVLSYSTYLGGSDWDEGYGITVDSAGNAYVTGWTSSIDFPLQNPLQGVKVGYSDVFVTKLSASGNTPIYSTYLGGSNSESGEGIAVDSAGNAYVTGYTWSPDFPTQNPFQGSYAGGGDAFVTKLSEPVTLKVLRPNGGEKWKAGFKYTIRWEAPLNSYKFTLRYSTDNKRTWTTIKTVLASNRCTSDGTKYTCRYGWTVPAQDGRKPQSFVRVIARDSANQLIGRDDSNKAFVIEVLKLISPNGGETLTAGQTYQIKWETYALTKPVAEVRLQYSTNGGSSWSNITTLTGNPGQYNWTVPNTPSNNCKVKVILKDSTGATIASDVSDRVFTITQ
ncbi:MAG: SBBP repeat-containing protein, partial [Thermodesulfovibrionaceae bacterium]